MKINIVEDEIKATVEEQQRRQQLCDNCPLYNKHDDTCTSCGCLIERKKLYASDTCPEGNW
jgi:formamidopyrimidine-DNA glycosylase